MFIGIKKVIDMVYELIKEVIDEVWLFLEYFQIKFYVCVCLVELIYVVIVCYCIWLCGRVFFDFFCCFIFVFFCDVLLFDCFLGLFIYIVV